MIQVVIPVNEEDSAKSRLSSMLTPDQRWQLNLAMFEDVVSVASLHPGVAGVLVISDNPTVAAIAKRHSARLFSEKKAGVIGLNAALDAGCEYLVADGLERILILHSDLPLFTSSDLDALNSLAAAPADVVLGADVRNEGTNALLFNLGKAPKLQFGINSLAKHKAGCTSIGLGYSVIERPGISQDVDTPADLEAIMTRARDGECGKRTTDFLSKLKLQTNSDVQAHEVPKPDKNAFINEMIGKRFLRKPMTDDQFLSLAEVDDLQALTAASVMLRDQGFANVVTYSRKVFIPLTKLCRDVCHYCTFAKTPRQLEQLYMSVEEVLCVCRKAEAVGCKEALFTLGEKPELRYPAARKALNEMGFDTTLEYLEHVAERVCEETSLLPHINAGCMNDAEILRLRSVSASMGVMLESASTRLCEKGMPHYGSPDKQPKQRLATIERAGKHKVPFTTGILIGIGETRRERIESLLKLRNLHEKYGHLQEIIVQNFKAKLDTKMAFSPEPDIKELMWTVAVTRLIFGAEMSIQAPPNLSPHELVKLINAGINDWGGVSPVTPDYVNPEAPWPNVSDLAAQTASAGKHLTERLTIYPNFALAPECWLDQKLRTKVMRKLDASGYPRTDRWVTGTSEKSPDSVSQMVRAVVDVAEVSGDIVDILSRHACGVLLEEAEITRLLNARGKDFTYVCNVANQIRQRVNGNVVSYAVNRNINYTNICYFNCRFCAFSKGKHTEQLRGKSYDLDFDEIARRSKEAWSRGATEVCMQGGIHPQYTGQHYLDIVKTVKTVVPEMHVHAFSPLEIWQGAKTLDISCEKFLRQLKDAGLGSLPGTAAEILDDQVRLGICPDKLNSKRWLEIIETAHNVGLQTTATMMFGHIDKPIHWARHLIEIRKIQCRTGGFTEFVPLPFVANEAPIYLRGQSRGGPTFRECILVHAVARIVFEDLIDNIQASWVKLGTHGLSVCLDAGVNDVGGTLMNESITRAAGAAHGQEWSPQEIEATISVLKRVPFQRTTLYQAASSERTALAKNALPLQPVVKMKTSRTYKTTTKTPIITESKATSE